MRKLLIFGLLLIGLMVHGQAIPGFNAGVVSGQVIASSSSASASDNFNSYANNYILTNSSNWGAEDGLPSPHVISNPTGSDGSARTNTSGTNCSYYIGNFSDDQYSQATAVSIGGSFYTGVAVRCSQGDSTYYAWMARSTQSRLFRVRNGSVFYALYGDGWSDDDVVRIEIEADTLKFYRNGSLDTSMDSDGIWVDDSAFKISTGNPGIAGTGANIEAVDNWSGGDL